MLKTITLPNAKSLVVRELIANFVRCGEVFAVSPDESGDVLVTHKALTVIRDARCQNGGPVTVDVADCGAAYRFLMALLSTTEGEWLLTGTPRLLQRPMHELVTLLQQAGSRIVQVQNGWRISGAQWHADTLSVDITRTSQYASALLLIAPLIGLKTLHINPHDAGSLSYVNLTRHILTYDVEVPEVPFRRQPVGRLGDWSSALFFYAYALLHQEDDYLLEGLSLQSAQGDAVVASWFSKLGLESREVPQGVLLHATASDLSSCTFDVADHPDTVPVMAALACLLSADFMFLHTENLQYKESDRGAALAAQLQPFATVTQTRDTLRFVGKPRSQWPRPRYRFQTLNDHRLAMAFLLFGADAEVDSVDCLRKSWGERCRNLLKFR